MNVSALSKSPEGMGSSTSTRLLRILKPAAPPGGPSDSTRSLTSHPIELTCKLCAISSQFGPNKGLHAHDSSRHFRSKLSSPYDIADALDILPKVQTDLDHIVWATPDLEPLVTEVARRLGVYPVEGGRHEGNGTRNYLVGLGRGHYLELIGPDHDQPSPRHPRPFGLDWLDAPRVCAWAVRTTAIEQTIATVRAAGYNPGEAKSMTRSRPDGSDIQWKLTPPPRDTSYGVHPFIIDWLQSSHPSTNLPTVKGRILTLIHPKPNIVERVLESLRVKSRISLHLEYGPKPEITLEVDCVNGQVRLPN